MTTSIQAKGISIRFLACPPEDSIVRYQVYRSDSTGGVALRLGEVAALAGRDTLDFQDLLAEKGRPYYYTIKGLNADGVSSDPSEETEVGFPILSLPDTLLPDKLTGQTRAVLPLSVDPLRGSAPLALALMDSSRFSVSFDSAARTASFRSRSGRADTGWVVLRAQYFGKFEDKVPLLIIVAATGTVSLPALSASSAAAFLPVFPASYSPLSQGPLSLDRLPGPGRLEILTLRGTRSVAMAVSGPRARVWWNGTDDSGRMLRPARYLWVMRGLSGSVVRSGSLLILP
ncbi:MAG: hypothetical protein JWO30_1044 [Fibrobacteres bacterium]|nr:hypothetical protein [Fibrobacterota bacterium]